MKKHELLILKKSLTPKDKRTVATEFGTSLSNISMILNGKRDNDDILIRLSEVALERKEKRNALSKNLSELQEITEFAKFAKKE